LDALSPRAVMKDGARVVCLKANAQQVLSDATFLLTAFEQELTHYTPETPADMLTQMLVLSSYFNGHALDEGSDAEKVVRLLISRLLEGLFNLAGRDSSPVFEGYFVESTIWAHRLGDLERPLSAQPGPEPFVAA
jgi:hypothetical protein